MRSMLAIMLIIYGTIIMSMILDIKIKDMSSKMKIIISIYASCVFIVNVLAPIYLSEELYGRYYPFLLQIPFLIGFWIISPYKGMKLLFAMLSIIIFASPTMMCLTILRTFYNIGMPTSLIVAFICYMLMILFVRRFLKTDFNYIFEYCDSRQFWIFCIIPILFYIYSYGTTSYNFFRTFAKEGYFIRQIPVIIVFVSYILLIRVFRSTRESQKLQEQAHMLHLQFDHAQVRLKEMKQAQEQTAFLRHDMRHHVSLLNGFAIEEDLGKIKTYLADLQESIEQITPKKFCANETVNLIISSFIESAHHDGIEICEKINIPEKLPISDTEICTILSNALENAIAAVKKIDNGQQKKIIFHFKYYNEKIIIEISNPYCEEIKLTNGLPSTTKVNHGFGIKSVIAIVSKHKGIVSFDIKDNQFIMRVVI